MGLALLIIFGIVTILIFLAFGMREFKRMYNREKEFEKRLIEEIEILQDAGLFIFAFNGNTDKLDELISRKLGRKYNTTKK